jgi:MFS family permease
LTFMELVLFSISQDPDVEGTPLESPKSAVVAFFVGAIVSSIPGGYAAERYGGKLVLLYGMFMWSLSTALLPPYVGKNDALFTAFRGIQGCSQGVILPSSFQLISAWFPDHERSLALSATLCSLDLGLWVAVSPCNSPLFILFYYFLYSLSRSLSLSINQSLSSLCGASSFPFLPFLEVPLIINYSL